MDNHSTSEEASSQCTDPSSYYGPGSLSAWYLLILSVIVTWRYSKKTGFRAHRIAITTDFIAVMLYPLLSACHLIYLLFGCSLSQDLLESVLESPLSPGTNSTTTEEEVQSNTHNETVNISSALRVLEIFTVLVICGLIPTLHHELNAERTSPTTFTLLGGFLWSISSWTILFYKSWQHGALLHAVLHFWYLGYQVLGVYYLPLTLLGTIAPFTWLFRQGINVYKHFYAWLIKLYRKPSVLLRQYFREAIQFLYGDGLIFLTIFPISWFITTLSILPSWPWLDVPTSSQPLIITYGLVLLFPNTETNIYELDQIAAIIGGALTLLFSIYDVTKDMNIIGNAFER